MWEYPFELSNDFITEALGDWSGRPRLRGSPANHIGSTETQIRQHAIDHLFFLGSGFGSINSVLISPFGDRPLLEGMLWHGNTGVGRPYGSAPANRRLTALLVRPLVVAR